MVKRSRHRRPLLPPVPLSRHLVRACLIRPQPSVLKYVRGPSQKRLRLRSPVTPYRSSQTQSASISVKREILSLGGPRDIADPNVVEAKVNTAQAFGPPPPRFPDCPDQSDEFKCLRVDRLRRIGDFYYTYDLQQYKEYLEWYYNLNRLRHPVTRSVADAASQCLEKEANVYFWWNTKEAVNFFRETLLTTRRIVCRMYSSVNEVNECLPFGVDAALCIAKEGELIIEWLRKRGPPLRTDEEYILCHKIRGIAYNLFDFEGHWSASISAALVGIRMEAGLLIENLRFGSDESVSTSMKIRQFALDFIIWQMYDEYGLNLSESSETGRDDDGTPFKGETKRVFTKEPDSGHSKNCLCPQASKAKYAC